MTQATCKCLHVLLQLEASQQPGVTVHCSPSQQAGVNPMSSTETPYTLVNCTTNIVLRSVE